MKFATIFQGASASLADRCSRYEQPGSEKPRLDDMQRRWIEVWSAPYTRN